MAGIGTGLVALGIWLHVLSPSVAATLVILCSLVSQTQTFPLVRRTVEPANVWPFILPGLLGVPIGAHLLVNLDGQTFKTCIGAFLLAFSACMLAGNPSLRIAWGGRAANVVIGFGGGLLGGASGLSGSTADDVERCSRLGQV